MPLRQKLIMFIVLITVSALVFTLAFIYNYDKQALKSRMANELIAEASIVGTISTAAVYFDTPDDAREYLSSFMGIENIEAACILKHDTVSGRDTVFAAFYREEIVRDFHIPEKIENNYRFIGDKLEILVDIFVTHEKVSSVYIRSDTQEITKQLNTYLRVIGFVLLLAVVYIIVIAVLLGRSVSKPILHLASVTDKISKSKNYELRVEEREGHDETSILFRGFNHMIDQIEKKNTNIMNALDAISEQKEKIQLQKDEIENKSKKLTVAVEELKEKNKNIVDSITYAQRLQNSIFPPVSLIRQYISNVFVFFRPRDIISGDFYWFSKKDSKVFFAAVDCTGHGVPGAILSIVGNNLLEQIVNVNGIEKPSHILDNLNAGINQSFHDKDDMADSLIVDDIDYEFYGLDKDIDVDLDLDIDTTRDGMDISLCMLDLKTNLLQFSGAFNPLYVVRNKNLIEIKADRYSIGYNFIEGEFNFANHNFQLQKDDMIYIFSDGFADQFGGPNGKKYMYQQFKDLLISVSNKPVEIQNEIVANSFNEWKGSLDQVDDVLMIGIKI